MRPARRTAGAPRSAPTTRGEAKERGRRPASARSTFLLPRGRDGVASLEREPNSGEIAKLTRRERAGCCRTATDARRMRYAADGGWALSSKQRKRAAMHCFLNRQARALVAAAALLTLVSSASGCGQGAGGRSAVALHVGTGRSPSQAAPGSTSCGRTDRTSGRSCVHRAIS
jgi:hypothetical protein